MMPGPDPLSPQALAQEQFLLVQSRAAAGAAFLAALCLVPLGEEIVALDQLPGRVLARDIAAPVDAPPFDRAMVDGFAVCAADLFEASGVRSLWLRLNPETIACGTAPALPVLPGTATPIATDGPIPRIVTARLWPPARGEVVSVDYVVIGVVTDVVCGGGSHAGRCAAWVGASAALDG